MFKQVLLCHDGSDDSRRALRRGADLAIALKSKIFVLTVVPKAVTDSLMLAQSTGHACGVDPACHYHDTLAQSMQFLRSRGIEADGSVATGDTVATICEYAKRIGADLIVVGYYPSPTGGRWWSGSQNVSLADRAGCCVLVAKDE